MKHLLSYVAGGAVLLIGVGIFLLEGIGTALVIVGALILALSVYSAERINNVFDQD